MNNIRIKNVSALDAKVTLRPLSPTAGITHIGSTAPQFVNLTDGAVGLCLSPLVAQAATGVAYTNFLQLDLDGTYDMTVDGVAYEGLSLEEMETILAVKNVTVEPIMAKTCVATPSAWSSPIKIMPEWNVASGKLNYIQGLAGLSTLDTTALTTIQDIMVGMKKTITQLDWRVSATDPDAVEMRFLPIDVGNNAAITSYNYPATSGPMVTEDLDGVETTVWTVAIDSYWTGPLSYTNCV